MNAPSLYPAADQAWADASYEGRFIEREKAGLDATLLAAAFPFSALPANFNDSLFLDRYYRHSLSQGSSPFAL